MTHPNPHRMVKRAAAALTALGLGALALPAAAQAQDAGQFLYHTTTYVDAEGGDHVFVYPDYLQNEPLPEDTAALVVEVVGDNGRVAYSGPGSYYDNCISDYYDGVTCVVTDFEDLPGTAFRFADPITFGIDETVPGPVSICLCTFTVEALNAEELDERYGDVEWDTSPGDVFEIEVEEDPEDPVFA